MGYALIWIESLATAFLLIAALTAWSAQASGRLGQRFGPLVGAALIALGAGAMTCGIGFIRFANGVELPWFYYAFAWTLSFGVGSILLMRSGFVRGATEAPRARSWPLARLALALGALVLITWTTFTNMDLAIRMQLGEVRSEAGAKILAVMPPRVPDRDNAALLYREAFAGLMPQDQAVRRWKEKAQAWMEHDVARFDARDPELRDYLGSQARSLALVRAAAAMPACWFEHDYFHGADMILPEIYHLRQCATLLGLHALHQAAQGDSRAALDDVAAMFGVARHIDDPLLISMVSAISVEKAASAVLSHVLRTALPKPEDLRRVVLDEKVSYQRYFHRACQMEESGLGLSCYTLLDGSSDRHSFWIRESFDPFGLAIAESSFYRVFFLQSDLAGYRRMMKQAQLLAQRPYYEVAPNWEVWDRTILTQGPGIIARLIIPTAQRCAPLAAEGDAAHQLARLALATTEYRLKHGKYPDTLEALAPQHLAAIPRDPFDGQPLRLKRDGKDVLLYSIGRDLKDDGGAAWDEGRKTGDVVMRLANGK